MALAFNSATQMWTGPGFGCAVSLARLSSIPIPTLVGAITQRYAAAGLPGHGTDAIRALEDEIAVLQQTALALEISHPKAKDWGLVLEFDVPRRRKRIDAIVLSESAIAVLEFKSSCHETEADRRQVEDYCLELADFHAGSRDVELIPILVPVASDSLRLVENQIEGTDVHPVSVAGASRLAEALAALIPLKNAAPNHITVEAWLSSSYSPTPTITEAAAHLYAQHDVIEIARSEAGSSNLDLTLQAIAGVINDAHTKDKKAVCFVTGVPGAGKTLAGLNAVCSPAVVQQGEAVFLSGNGPLVKVLTEALARDDRDRNGTKIGDARRKSGKFVQDIHAFIDHYRERDDAPEDCVVVFDEAQRAWNAEHSYRKFKRAASEPITMLRILDRQPNWAVLICLVGGGQEINTGEAGLREWGRALETEFPHWHIAVSPALLDGVDHEIGQTLFAKSTPDGVKTFDALHLDVPLRAYRGTRVADWVEAVLDYKPIKAHEIANQLNQFEIVLTRSLHRAKSWLKETTKGNRRSGMVASSGGRRLRRFGMTVDVRIDVAKWFLDGRDDVRSSHYHELPATEFDIQGLELDRVGVCWDADLKMGPEGWQHRKFVGSKWQQVKKPANRTYLLNKYRVLLTRAREGMVIWIPAGDPSDQYSQPESYDQTAKFLLACGVTSLDHSSPH
jgi:hypothetical protein